MGASAARLALLAAECPYWLGSSARNAWYDWRGSAVHRVGCPVICVGNLTVGGTGKTPMVKWVARRLRERGLRVALLSRGYGAGSDAVNDEALELEQSLPDVPHLQGRDRVQLAETAIYEFESQVLLLDDGFQHRRLGRDLDVVLLDATNPFGHGHLLPRGLLRESIRGLRRAGVVCLTRSTSIEPGKREAIRRRVARVAPAAKWCEAEHAPSGLLNASGERTPLESLRGQRVLGFCGIGNPAAFAKTLADAGAEVVAFESLPDHHRYTREDVAALGERAAALRVDRLVCTHKDLVKLCVDQLAGVPLSAVTVEMRLLVGEEQMLVTLDEVARSCPPSEL